MTQIIMGSRSGHDDRRLWVPYCPACNAVAQRPAESLKSWGSFLLLIIVIGNSPEPIRAASTLIAGLSVSTDDKQKLKDDLGYYAQWEHAHANCGPLRLRSDDGRDVYLPRIGGLS